MGEIKALTSLRGIFALWVLIFHLRAWSDLRDFPMPIIDHGYLGVDFFFLLSGFILAARHGPEFAGFYNPLQHLQFLARRIFRIFPLHWVVLALWIGTMWLKGEPQYWRGHILNEALLVHRWGFIRALRASLNGPDWSLSTEWASNILFPLFVFATGVASKSVIRPVVTVAVAFAGLVFLQIWHGNYGIADANSYLPLIRCFSEFALGMVLFRWRDYFGRVSAGVWIMTVSAIAAIGLLAHSDVVVVLAMIVILPALSLNGGRTSATLSSRVVHYIGTISYSIYLIQLEVMFAIDDAFAGSKFGPFAHWVGVPVAVVLLSVPTYNLIEKPMAGLWKFWRFKGPETVSLQ